MSGVYRSAFSPDPILDEERIATGSFNMPFPLAATYVRTPSLMKKGLRRKNGSMYGASSVVSPDPILDEERIATIDRLTRWDSNRSVRTPSLMKKGLRRISELLRSRN